MFMIAATLVLHRDITVGLNEWTQGVGLGAWINTGLGLGWGRGWRWEIFLKSSAGLGWGWDKLCRNGWRWGSLGNPMQASSSKQSVSVYIHELCIATNCLQKWWCGLIDIICDSIAVTTTIRSLAYCLLWMRPGRKYESQWSSYNRQLLSITFLHLFVTAVAVEYTCNSSYAEHSGNCVVWSFSICSRFLCTCRRCCACLASVFQCRLLYRGLGSSARCCYWTQW